MFSTQSSYPLSHQRYIILTAKALTFGFRSADILKRFAGAQTHNLMQTWQQF